MAPRAKRARLEAPATMSYGALRTALKHADLSTKGKTAQLAARLEEHRRGLDADVGVSPPVSHSLYPYIDSSLRVIRTLPKHLFALTSKFVLCEGAPQSEVARFPAATSMRATWSIPYTLNLKR